MACIHILNDWLQDREENERGCKNRAIKGFSFNVTENCGAILQKPALGLVNSDTVHWLKWYDSYTEYQPAMGKDHCFKDTRKYIQAQEF